jgi:hypothetical protein
MVAMVVRELEVLPPLAREQQALVQAVDVVVQMLPLGEAQPNFLLVALEVVVQWVLVLAVGAAPTVQAEMVVWAVLVQLLFTGNFFKQHFSAQKFRASLYDPHRYLSLNNRLKSLTPVKCCRLTYLFADSII